MQTSGTILLVEDETLVSDMIRQMLGRLFPDLEVRTARDGEEAIDMLDDHVRCVLSDVIMPRLNGLQLCWSIRNTAPCRPWRKVPVILMSALSEEKVLAHAWGAGTAAFLPKPFHMADLARVVAAMTGVPPLIIVPAQPAPAAPTAPMRQLPAKGRR